MNKDQSNLSTAVRGSNFIAPLVFCVALFAGLFASCKKNPVGPNGKDSCDTCSTDTTHKPPPPMDTTSHTFTWTQFSIPNEGILTGCWVFGPQNIYAMGGSMFRYDGKAWNEDTIRWAHGTLSGQLSGSSMFAFAENDYWIVDGTAILHVRNGNFADRFDPSTSPLHSSWGTSSSDMYSVGDGGTILHFDGTQWTKMNSGTTLDIKTIWGTSDRNVWACGYNPSSTASVFLHYDGSQWITLDLTKIGDIGPGRHSLDAVWSCDSAGSVVTIVSGSLLFRNTNLGPWRGDSAHIANKLGDGSYIGMFHLRGNSANDVVVAGDLGFVSHWNGKSWQRYDNLFNPGDGLFITNGLAIRGNTACVVGANSTGSWIAIGQR